MLKKVISLLAIIALGCGSGGSDEIDEYDEDTFVDAYITEMCALEIRCYEGTSPFDTQDDCENAAVDYGYFGFGEGCSFDEEAAATCIDEYSRSGCIDHFERTQPESCDAVFAGECAWHSRNDG